MKVAPIKARSSFRGRRPVIDFDAHAAHKNVTAEKAGEMAVRFKASASAFQRLPPCLRSSMSPLEVQQKQTRCMIKQGARCSSNMVMVPCKLKRVPITPDVDASKQSLALRAASNKFVAREKEGGKEQTATFHSIDLSSTCRKMYPKYSEKRNDSAVTMRPSTAPSTPPSNCSITTFGCPPNIRRTKFQDATGGAAIPSGILMPLF